jgi:hypothetical protein
LLRSATDGRAKTGALQTEKQAAYARSNFHVRSSGLSVVDRLV